MIAARRARGAVGAGVALGMTALLAACAAVAPQHPAGPLFTGKIAVRSDEAPGKEARSMTGQFELTGTAAAGQLVVTSPLGTTVARARWGDVYDGRPSDIVLQAQGHTLRFNDFEAMTEAALGDAVPLEALFDWLAGRPWPGSPAAFDASRGSFEQLGWRVDRSRLAADGLLSADRPAPPQAIHVRVKLDATGPSTGAPAPGGAASATAAPSQSPAAPTSGAPDRRALPVSPAASTAR